VLNELGVEPLGISAATGEGIQDVLDRLLQGVEPTPGKRKPAKEKFIDGAPARRKTGIVTTLEDGTFEVWWSKAQRLVALADTNDQRIVGQLFREFKRLGVIGALEAKGVKYGDPVQIGDWEFDWGDMIAPDMEW
jgi:Obg family GTPase CgtA-like protein